MPKTTNFLSIIFIFVNFVFTPILPFKYPELIASLNKKLEPCDDFYKYVCDGFDRKNIPRTDCSEISTTASRRQQTQKILEDLLANPPPLNPNLPQNLIQKLYGFHSACIQSSNKLTQSSDVILSKLNILTQKGNNNKRLFDTDWALKAFPINVFFQLTPLFNTNKPRTNLMRKSLGKGIIKREELLATRYGMIIQNLLEDDVWYSLKQNIQPVLLPSNNLFKGEIIPNCNGTQVKELILSEAERRVKNLFKVENKLAKQLDPSFLQRMGKIIGEFSEQEISDYLDWNTLWTFMPQMDKRYTLHYVNSKPPKVEEEVPASPNYKRCAMTKSWMTTNEKCEKFIEWYFPQIFDRLYLSKHLENGVRTEIGKIYSSVYSEFKRMLENNPWLDTITKGKALTKLQMLQANAVYFERIFDNNYLEGIYRHYNPLRTDVPFAEMVHTFEGASFLRQMATNDYYDSSWLVNAYYSRETNALVSLNGYLNPPIFSKDFLAVMNYAGIGVTLGHELSHAFDDWGSYYNGNGQMEDWLGPQMRAIFQKKKECFVKQYGNSKVQIDGVWINLNGTLTVNENIADNGGLNAAFKAWQVLKRSSSSLDQNIFGKIEGLEEFNGDQLFFIHYAFRQCSRLGSTWLRQRIMTEQHSVVPARVNIPLQNSPHFAKIFACPSGSPMNPVEKCAIW
uniref:Uncharacterized protein n=2 Tax=Meloidogyne TaxID=189290 RepID=A0A915NQS1_9BILA